jgi:hypothetical protein
MPALKNPQLYKTLQEWTDKLKLTPNDTDLRAKILTTNIYATSQEMGVSNDEATNVIKSYTAAYAVSQKLDPNALLQALTKEEQNILNYSASNPTLYGMSLSSANTLASYLGIGSGILLTIALGLFTVALFTVGPEAAAAIAAGEGVVATIGAALGAPLIAGGGFFFLLSQFLGHLSSGIPMMTKQMIDNGSIGPGLRISALKDAQDLEDKLNGTASPGPFTSAQFKDYASAIETIPITQIKDPQQNVTVPYSRTNLAKLITYIYGQQILAGSKATFSTIKAVLAPYLLGVGGAGAVSTANAKSDSVSGYAGYQSSTTTKNIKVFTGIVSEGVVSSDLTFTPRPSNLIESTDDIKTAAANNLAPFLQALPGKVIYEVRVVSSITTKDGFKQTGTTQRVQIGTYKNGLPKYKTVTNKFATLDLYIMTDKGTRTKITTIVLGPIDSAKVNATGSDIQMLQTQLPSLVTTTSIKDIQNITNIPVGQGTNTSQTTPQATPTATVAPTPVTTAPATAAPVVTAPAASPTTINAAFNPNNGQPLYVGQTVTFNGQSYTGTTPAAPAAPAEKPGANATTLTEWYSAHGRTLPSVQERSVFWEGYGLGPASYYTGTAEQNTIFLAKLKTL